MNSRQAGKYGRMETWTTPIYRGINCHLCTWTARLPRRGPGANALATAARLKGQLMEHLRKAHPEAVGGKEGGG